MLVAGAQGLGSLLQSFVVAQLVRNRLPILVIISVIEVEGVVVTVVCVRVHMMEAACAPLPRYREKLPGA